MKSEGIKLRGRNALFGAKPVAGPARAMLFVRNFFKHPIMLGSPVPSPRLLVDTLLKQVNWEETRVIVEYGPGVGNITGEILRRMQPEATLVAIETNGEF